MITMRTTLILNDELVAEARRYTGIEEKTALVHAGLKALIEREAARIRRAGLPEVLAERLKLGV